MNSPIADQYATRHNPFVYFHSVTDNQARCDSHVVPLGTVSVGSNGAPDTFSGHLARTSRSGHHPSTSRFVSPNLCNDGHDATCAGHQSGGGTTGGLTAANIWLKHWMPLIMNSPAYRSGHMLVVLTADEGNILDTRAGDNEQAGPQQREPRLQPRFERPRYQLRATTLPTTSSVRAGRTVAAGRLDFLEPSWSAGPHDARRRADRSAAAQPAVRPCGDR